MTSELLSNHLSGFVTAEDILSFPLLTEKTDIYLNTFRVQKNLVVTSGNALKCMKLIFCVRSVAALKSKSIPDLSKLVREAGILRLLYLQSLIT